MWEVGISILLNFDNVFRENTPLKSAYFSASQILYRLSRPANVKVRINII